MSGPRPLLLLLACLCAAMPRASAQGEDEVAALSRKAASLQSMAGAPHVVLIGDSHTVGPFGHELDARLRGTYPGWKIETFASCGSAPGWFLPGNAASGHPSACGTWFHRYSAKDPSKLEDVTSASPTPLIGTLVATHPDTVIVALGANMADWEKGGIFGMASARALADAIVAAGSRCLWIGPPDEAGHMPPDQAKAQVARLNAALRQSLGDSCRFLESHTTYTGSDPMRLHYPRGRPIHLTGPTISNDSPRPATLMGCSIMAGLPGGFDPKVAWIARWRRLPATLAGKCKVRNCFGVGVPDM